MILEQESDLGPLANVTSILIWKDSRNHLFENTLKFYYYPSNQVIKIVASLLQASNEMCCLIK